MIRALLLICYVGWSVVSFAQTADPALDAQDYFRRADYARAVPLLQQAIAADTANGTLVMQLAYSYVRLGQLPAAKRTYEALASRPGTEPREVLSQLAAIAEKELAYHRALGYYQRLIALDSTVSFYHRQAGYLSSRTGNTAAATRYYGAALKLNPDDLDTIADLATLYLNDGQKDALAAPLVQRGIRLDSNSVRILQLRARLNYRLNRFGEVIADVEKTMAFGDSAVYFQRMLGVAYYSTDQYEKSIATFERLLRVGEETEAVHAGLGTAHLLSFKPLRADSTKKKTFQWPSVAYNHFRQAIELGTSQKIPDYRMGMADALENEGQIDWAIKDYQRIFNETKRPKALYRLAQLHDKHKDDRELTMVYYQELISLCQKAKIKPFDCAYAELAQKRLTQLKARPAQSVAKDTTQKN
jgi:tetratricopeptide (TPR) repeat protein